MRLQQNTKLTQHVIGDIYEGENEYHIRLWTDPAPQNGSVYWVDFEIFEVIGYDAKDERRKFFNRKDSRISPDPVYSYDEAQQIVEGFVKWDGCTQFEFPDGVHIDDVRHLRALFDAIEKAREWAAGLMPGKIINDEYWRS